MRRILGACLLALVVLHPASAAPPPVEAFGTLPAESDAVMSPDGHWLAWLDHRQEKPRVVMFDATARKVQRVLEVPGTFKLRDLLWHDNETLLITLSGTTLAVRGSDTSAERFRVIAQDVTGGDGRILMPHAGLVSPRTSKPHTVLMQFTGPCNSVVANCLYEVDTRTGKSAVSRVGNDLTMDWFVDPEGKAVARLDWDWLHHEYRLFALDGNNVRELLRRPDADVPRVAGLTADLSALVLLAANGRAHEAAWAMPLDGGPMRVLAEDPENDITGVAHDPKTGLAIGVYVSGNRNEVKWFDAAAEQRYAALKRSFKGREVDLVSWTADGSRTLVRVEAGDVPPTYYLVDFKSHTADIAGEEYPALAGVVLGTQTSITYPARDGTPIPAFLTMPAGYRDGKVPLVVMPHGGPETRDYPGFDYMVQFLATRGYAVLQPQFRGSTGFGEAFHEAGYRQWGGLMQDDVTDGVRAMIERGVADAKRICIVGSSYGGYAALAGAAFTPELYACAVSVNGISDLPALMRSELPVFGGTVSDGISYWRKHIGEINDPKLDARSPIRAVNAVRAPVLLIYGTADARVPVDQSRKMADALKRAGKSVELVELPAEDHWLSRSETRTSMLRALGAFLNAHL